RATCVRFSSIEAAALSWPRRRIIAGLVPWRSHQELRHSTVSGYASGNEAGPNEGRDNEKPWGRQEAEHGTDECEAASANLHLPLQFNRLPAIGSDREAGPAPSVESALKYESFTG